MKIDLLGGTGGSRDDSVSQELTQNWYLSVEPTGKNNAVLYPTPGITEFSDFTPVNNYTARAGIDYDGTLFVVIGDTLYEVSATGSFISRGTLNSSAGAVDMAHNGSEDGQQIMIVDGTNGYIYDSSTTTLSTISDADFPGVAANTSVPTVVEYFDSYFIVNDPGNNGRFYISDSYDGTSWPGTFATAERSSDPLQNIVASNRILWLIGSKTAEPWFNSGASDFTFESIQSGFSQWGTPSAKSVSEFSGSIIYLSSNDDGDGQVVMTNGLQPQVISSTNITTEITKLSTYSDTYSYIYQHDGHNFYVLSFPTDGKTFVYDITLKIWHNWSSKTIGYHRSSFHVFVYGKHIVGDPTQGKLYYLDWDKYTDNGDMITRIRRSRSIHADGKAVRHRSLWLDIKEGVGDATTPDPQLMMRFRDDNGAWCTEKWKSMGKIGERNVRLIWRMLGRSRDRVYEFKVTDPVNAILIAGYLDADLDQEENK